MDHINAHYRPGLNVGEVIERFIRCNGDENSRLTTKAEDQRKTQVCVSD